MAKARENYSEIVKSHVAIDALWKFIQIDYPARDFAFSTSWSCYSITSTTEEDLLTEAFAALYESEDVDYLTELPSLITNLISERATKLSEQTRAIKFLNDAMTDLVQCHVRENAELEDDEYSVAA